jgi:hypothetical protein
MVERSEPPPRTGGESEGVEQDVASQGDEGRQSAAVTPPVGQDAEPGQTASPPAEGEVGVPSDEEIANEEREAGGTPEES